jgi:hypothetical protein
MNSPGMSKSPESVSHVMVRSVMVVVLVMFFVGSLPTGHSEELSEPYLVVGATPLDGPLRPIDGTGTIPFTITVVCETGTLYPSSEPYAVGVDVDTDQEWAAVLIRPGAVAFDLAPEECLAGYEGTIDGEIVLTFGPSAPAGAEVAITLSVRGPTDDAVEVVWTETVASYLNAQSRFEKHIWQVRPGSTTPMGLWIENVGNDAILVSSAIAEGTSDWLVVDLPDPFVVEPGQETSVEVLVKTGPTDGYVNRRDQVNVMVTVSALQDDTLEESAVRSLVVQTQGVIEAELSSLPYSVLVAPLVLGGVLVSRRRR